MSEIEVVAGHVEDSAETQLAALADIIRREYEMARAAAHSMVLHAVACGEALLKAKELIPPMQWGAWLDANVPNGVRRSMSRNYMRLAALKEHVDPDLSITSNVQLLRGLQARSSGTPRFPPEAKAEALRLHATGEFTNVEIAGMVGTTKETIRCWTDPEYAAAKSRQSDDRRQERVEARRAERAGVSVAEMKDDRAFRYGTPGRAALGSAVRRLAVLQGRDAVREALLDIEAICRAWGQSLEVSPARSNLIEAGIDKSLKSLEQAA